MTNKTSALSLRGKIVGALIREARLAQEISIEDCAQMAQISPERLEQFELGQSSPSLPELEGLAYYLNIPLENFWENRPFDSGKKEKKKTEMERLMALRHRMIGAILRQARLDLKLSLEDLEARTDIDEETLNAYELGEIAIPITNLEILSGALHRSIREFQDLHGPVGVWNQRQLALKNFMEMPLDLQLFVSKPINRPYLELAIRLSDMSVDKLRAVAEGLLEITY